MTNKFIFNRIYEWINPRSDFIVADTLYHRAVAPPPQNIYRGDAEALAPRFSVALLRHGRRPSPRVGGLSCIDLLPGSPSMAKVRDSPASLMALLRAGRQAEPSRFRGSVEDRQVGKIHEFF